MIILKIIWWYVWQLYIRIKWCVTRERTEEKVDRHQQLVEHFQWVFDKKREHDKAGVPLEGREIYLEAWDYHLLTELVQSWSFGGKRIKEVDKFLGYDVIRK